MRKLMLAGAGALALWSGAASAAEFVFTGAVQSYTVTRAGDYRIEATGASGGRPAADPDVVVGRGATIGGRVFLDAGTVLSIFVGGAGGDAPNTSQANDQVGTGAGGGGGGTFIFLGTGSFEAANTLIVAGGGGGAWLGAFGSEATGSDATGLTIGTDSGGGSLGDGETGGGGGAGVGSNGGGYLRYGGGGGLRPAEGAAGGKGGFGSLGNGGDGGFGGGGGGGGFFPGYSSGAGGGGGFAGGDGGDVNNYRGGGAGTSFIVASAIDRSGGTAAMTGNGRFTIDFLTSVVSPVPEPATWATMILGFGAIGVAMRRRRATPAARLA